MQLKTFIKREKRYFVFWLISIISFFLGVIFGIIFAGNINKINPNEVQAVNVFKNNILVGSSMMFLGSLTGGVYGIIVLYINGYIVGKLAVYLITANMGKYIFLGIFPHFGLELLGLSIFAIIGFIPASEFICWIRKGSFRLPVKEILKKYIAMLSIGSICLFFAALIESYVSVVI